MSDHIGATIRRLRLARHISQASLADAAGIRQQSLYRAERGDIRQPKVETLQKIAAHLGVAVETLLVGRGAHKATIPHKRARVKRGA
jgi:transcriptional regulator with XRE-family HTH domain